MRAPAFPFVLAVGAMALFGDLTYFNFLAIDGDVELLNVSPGTPPEDPEALYQEALESQHSLDPNWEAVGIQVLMLRQDSSRPDIELRLPLSPLYDIKLLLKEQAKQWANEQYGRSFFNTSSVPEFANQEAVHCITFERNEETRWVQKDAPVERAVNASESVEVAGWPVSMEEGEPVVHMDVESDLFGFATTEAQAQEIERSGKIQGFYDSVMAHSMVWGWTFLPGAEPATHVVVFRTSEIPSGCSTGGTVIWDTNELSVAPVATVPLEKALDRMSYRPLPTLAETGARLREDFDTAEREYVGVRYARSLPIGLPGGPCHVIRNIQEERLPERLKQELIEDIEKGKDLSNQEAHRVYDNEIVRTKSDLFSKLELTAHSIYRMDQRGVTVWDVQKALDEFSRWYKAHRLNTQRLKRHEVEIFDDLARGKPVRFDARKSGLTIVFVLDSRDKGRLVSTWWTDTPNPPKPRPGECEHIPLLDERWEDSDRPKILGSELTDPSTWYEDSYEDERVEDYFDWPDLTLDMGEEVESAYGESRDTYDLDPVPRDRKDINKDYRRRYHTDPSFREEKKREERQRYDEFDVRLKKKRQREQYRREKETQMDLVRLAARLKVRVKHACGDCACGQECACGPTCSCQKESFSVSDEMRLLPQDWDTDDDDFYEEPRPEYAEWEADEKESAEDPGGWFDMPEGIDAWDTDTFVPTPHIDKGDYDMYAPWDHSNLPD